MLILFGLLLQSHSKKSNQNQMLTPTMVVFECNKLKKCITILLFHEQICRILCQVDCHVKLLWCVAFGCSLRGRDVVD